jgi:hypothetical protein
VYNLFYQNNMMQGKKGLKNCFHASCVVFSSPTVVLGKHRLWHEIVKKIIATQPSYKGTALSATQQVAMMVVLSYSKDKAISNDWKNC